MIYKAISELVGGTPLLCPVNYQKKEGLLANLLLKLEYFNPAGSVKDRPALLMIEEAERTGKLKPGSIIIEPTSGNTGVALAAMARSRGYRVILTMPETMSVERRQLLTAYGAELILTEGAKGMTGAILKAGELLEANPGSFCPSQFTNKVNAKAHYNSTGPELWRGTEGKLDILVVGVGTGGTITGCAKYLKEKNPDIKIVAVEPADSPVLSKGKSGSHGIQGIGAGFIPEVLDRAAIDEIITIATADAHNEMRAMVEYEGILLGISSGAAIHAGKILAMREENRSCNIAVICPDGGEKYLSMGIYGA